MIRDVSDDTEYVQGFIDRGEPVPMGEYDCPRGIAISDGYFAQAAARGRAADAPASGGRGFRLSEPPGALIRHGSGFLVLTGWIAPREDPGSGYGVSGEVQAAGTCATTLGGIVRLGPLV